MKTCPASPSGMRQMKKRKTRLHQAHPLTVDREGAEGRQDVSSVPGKMTQREIKAMTTAHSSISRRVSSDANSSNKHVLTHRHPAPSSDRKRPAEPSMTSLPVKKSKDCSCPEFKEEITKALQVFLLFVIPFGGF